MLLKEAAKNASKTFRFRTQKSIKRSFRSNGDISCRLYIDEHFLVILEEYSLAPILPLNASVYLFPSPPPFFFVDVEEVS